MLSSIILPVFAACMSASVLAGDVKRQATNGAQFTSAADQLISNYIPATAMTAFESAVSSAASAAKVTGEPKSLIYSALVATTLPSWFESAIPSQWSTQIAALESDISALRAVPTSVYVVYVTTTNSAGSTITSSEVVTATTNTITATKTAASVYSSLTTKVVSGVTSVATVIYSGGSSVGSQITSGYESVTTKVVSGVTSVITAGVSGGSSVVSAGKSGASSVVSDVTGSTTATTAGAAYQTAVAGAAAGVGALVGLMVAL